MNETQPSSCFNATEKRIGKTSVYILLFFVSLAGNTFIGAIVYKRKAMRKPINFFIVNMAMSDLLFPIFLFPRKVTEIQVGSWLISGPLGQALCKLGSFLTFVSRTVSVQSLVLIAVDRFGAVVFPLRSPLISSKQCPFFILATWIIAMAFQWPEMFLRKLIEYPGRIVCVRQWVGSFAEWSSFKKNYDLVIIVALYCAPLFFITILYVIILLKLKSQKIPGEPSVNAEQQRIKRERNVLKMSIAIVLACALCWLPFSIGWLLSLVSTDSGLKSSCGFKYYMSTAFLLVCLHCAINPFICCIFSGNYRQGLKNLLSCFSAGRRSNQATPCSNRKE